MRRFIALFAKSKNSNGNYTEPESSPTFSKLDSKKIKISSIEFELEIYGSLDNPLFTLETFIVSLNQPNLSSIVTTKFENNIDYKMDSSHVYMTYTGVLKMLFTYSKSNVAIGFKKWYESTFMERNNYIALLSEIFSKFELPCIYLLYIGDYKGHKNVYKFGRTDNFIRRYKELNKAYNCLFKIYTLQYIDPEYLSKAENEVSKLVADQVIKVDNHNELFTTEDPTSIAQKYKEIGTKYAMNNKEMKERLNELVNKNKLLEMELSLANSLKDLANEKLRNYI